MESILPIDQSLVQIGEHAFVQKNQKIRWISPNVAIGSVGFIQSSSVLSQWVNSVDRAGGKWASDEELLQI